MKEDRSSKATREAFFSLFGPFGIANLLCLLMFLVLLIFRPNFNDPGTYWALVLMFAFGISALIVVLVGSWGRLRQLSASAREDRRRIAAHLPVERENPPDTPEPPVRGQE